MFLKRLRDFRIDGADAVRTAKTKRAEKEIKARNKAKEKEEHIISQSQVTCAHSFGLCLTLANINK
jgi:hypothetical protein